MASWRWSVRRNPPTGTDPQKSLPHLQLAIHFRAEVKAVRESNFLIQQSEAIKKFCLPRLAR